MNSASAARFLAPEVTELLVGSSSIEGRFRIRVFVPIRDRLRCEAFPVLYATDADYFFPTLCDIASQIQMYGEMQRAVIVGIGYEQTADAHALRWRDFLTFEQRDAFGEVIDSVVSSPFLAGSQTVQAIRDRSDARHFARFIQSELAPMIEARYPVRRGPRGYLGYSAGATFGLQLMGIAPELCSTLILGSPAVSYGRAELAAQLTQSIPHHLAVQRCVFLSVGEQEEFGSPYRFCSGYYSVAELLQAIAPELHLVRRIFPGETHATAWLPAFAHGLKAMFPAHHPELPWLEKGERSSTVNDG